MTDCQRCPKSAFVLPKSPSFGVFWTLSVYSVIAFALILASSVHRGPPTTHHPHKRPSSSGGIFGGVVCELSEPKKRQNTHHPRFCTHDVDRRFCGGGVWISRSDVQCSHFAMRVLQGEGNTNIARCMHRTFLRHNCQCGQWSASRSEAPQWLKHSGPCGDIVMAEAPSVTASSACACKHEEASDNTSNENLGERISRGSRISTFPRLSRV